MTCFHFSVDKYAYRWVLYFSPGHSHPQSSTHELNNLSCADVKCRQCRPLPKSLSILASLKVNSTTKLNEASSKVSVMFDIWPLDSLWQTCGWHADGLQTWRVYFVEQKQVSLFLDICVFSIQICAVQTVRIDTEGEVHVALHIVQMPCFPVTVGFAVLRATKSHIQPLFFVLLQGRCKMHFCSMFQSLANSEKRESFFPLIIDSVRAAALNDCQWRVTLTSNQHARFR